MEAREAALRVVAVFQEKGTRIGGRILRAYVPLSGRHLALAIDYGVKHQWFKRRNTALILMQSGYDQMRLPQANDKQRLGH